MWVQMRGDGWGCGVSAIEYSYAHHLTWSPSKLFRSNSIFNLCLLCIVCTKVRWEGTRAVVIAISHVFLEETQTPVGRVGGLFLLHITTPGCRLGIVLTRPKSWGRQTEVHFMTSVHPNRTSRLSCVGKPRSRIHKRTLLRFPCTMFTIQTIFKPILLGGEGRGVKSISRGDWEEQGGKLFGLLSQLRPRIRPPDT